MENTQESSKGKAYHEAGHVVFGIIFGREPDYVKIDIAGDGSDTFTRWKDVAPTQGTLTADAIRPFCLTLIAGDASHERFAPEANYVGADFQDRYDLRKIYKLVSENAESELDARFRDEVREALRLSEIAHAIERVADALQRCDGILPGAKAIESAGDLTAAKSLLNPKR